MSEEKKYCKVCGEELTEQSKSKEKKDLCIDCELNDGSVDDHSQQNVNQEGAGGADEEETL